MSYEFKQVNGMELVLKLNKQTNKDIGLPQDNKSVNTDFETLDDAIVEDTREEPL